MLSVALMLENRIKMSFFFFNLKASVFFLKIEKLYLLTFVCVCLYSGGHCGECPGRPAQRQCFSFSDCVGLENQISCQTWARKYLCLLSHWIWFCLFFFFQFFIYAYVYVPTWVYVCHMLRSVCRGHSKLAPLELNKSASELPDVDGWEPKPGFSVL